MGKPTGFVEYQRIEPPKRPVRSRIRDHHEIEGLLPEKAVVEQAARCMECGIPYCHAFGCPLQNCVPDWNDLVYRQQWRKALGVLQFTCPFPEITARVCPAPCEAACTLSLDQAAVTIRHIELQIAERGWREGWIQPEPACYRSGKSVAIAGSGPAGLAAAQRLARFGHRVVVFESSDRVGGILRYGIPDFKLEKWVLDRRLDQLRGEGVIFEVGVRAGEDVSARYLQNTFNATIIAAGAGVPRDLTIPGRNLKDIHFAMDFLTQQNRQNAGESVPEAAEITARGREVVVIGGGDTGSDCVGTARRQGATRIVQIEVVPKPPEEWAASDFWPTWPIVLRTSTSQEEGCERLWSILAKEFIGENGHVTGLCCVRLEWSPPDEAGRRNFKEVTDSEFLLKAEIVLLATGFLHMQYGKLAQDLNLLTDARGNLNVDRNMMTSTRGVFAAGDSVLGPSLVVRALAQGCQVADAVDRYLRGI